MDAVAENRLNERIDEVARDIAKIWGAHRELAVIVHGAMGDNGLRSDVRAIEEWRAAKESSDRDLSARLQHYIDAEREATCHGKKALDEHIEYHTKVEEGNMKIKEANISATALILSTAIPASLSALITVLVAFGVIG